MDYPSTQLQYWECHHLHHPLLRKDGKLATLAIKAVVVAEIAVVVVVVAAVVVVVIPAVLAEIEAQMPQVTIEGDIFFVYPTRMAPLLLLQQ